jgi:TnpA family transposase
MAQRPLLKADRWVALLGVPTDEEMLIRHYTLPQAELDLVQAKTAACNQLGLAIQLCLIRHIGRCWQYEEMLPAPMVAFVAEQIDVPTTMLAEYDRRSQTRREHAIEAQRHLGLHPAGREDRRAFGACFRQALGQRLDLLLGRSVLSRRRPGRQAQ